MPIRLCPTAIPMLVICMAMALTASSAPTTPSAARPLGAIASVPPMPLLLPEYAS